MCFPDELSLHQGRRKSTSGLCLWVINCDKRHKALPAWPRRLNAPCGKRNNYLDLSALTAGQRPGRQPAVAMNTQEEHELREQLARLLQEHRDLDAAIDALIDSPGSDLIQVQRLKKRKLVLRDQIRRIDDQLTPDIIA